MRFLLQRDRIDRDHADITALMHRIREASDAEDFQLTIGLLIELQALEEAHYASEETLMIDAGFWMHSEHRAEHAQLIDTLRSINQALLSENCRAASPSIAAHLEAALQHIRESDTRMWAHVDS